MSGSSVRRSGMTRVKTRDHSFIICQPTHLSTSGMSHAHLYVPAPGHRPVPRRVVGLVGVGGLVKY